MAGEPGLFDGSEGADGPEERAPSPFSGERADAMRAKIGRPAGSRNKRDADFERWFYARGYQDPAVKLAEVYSEDPRVLRAWFEDNAKIGDDGERLGVPSLLEVVIMQIKAAGELMPYLHGKKPIDVNVSAELLPTLIIAAGTNQVDQVRELVRQRALAVGVPLAEIEANEIKDLEGGE